MDKKLLIASFVLFTCFGVIGMAVISSFGKIAGYATVKPLVILDIVGSSNDKTYTLPIVNQGETKFSPQIKIENTGNSTVKVNFSLTISEGSEKDVNLTIVNEFKNETLTNPLLVPPSDLKIYIRHDFSPTASVGNYTFEFEVIPS